MGCPMSVAQEKRCFFSLITYKPSSASQKLYFQCGEMLLGAQGDNDTLVCMYDLKEREKTMCGETLT